MKYIIHNSNNVVTKVKTVSREGRIQALRDYIDEARSQVKSDVGPTEEPTVVVTKELVFKHLVSVCRANNIDLLDMAEMLMEVDTVSEAEETKVAA